jgi:hypothetical protein
MHFFKYENVNDLKTLHECLLFASLDYLMVCDILHTIIDLYQYSVVSLFDNAHWS